MGEYVPQAGQEKDKLPGIGGIYNTINMHTYAYTQNNPINLTDPDGEFPWAIIPIVIFGLGLLRSDQVPPPREVDITKTINKLTSPNVSYGRPRDNEPTLRDPNSNLDTRDRVKIGNNVLAAVGASWPTGGLAPENYNDSHYGRSGTRRDAMAALGLIGNVAGRVRNSDGYFAGDIIFEVYKTGGKVTNWLIREAYTLADGTHGYSEWNRDVALKWTEENKDLLNFSGKLDEINGHLGL
jgi:hypothetical protein